MITTRHKLIGAVFLVAAAFVFDRLLVFNAWAQMAQVVSDPGLTAIEKVRAASEETFQKWQHMQMVEDAINLKNTALAVKGYADYFAMRSKHRGGLLGFYRDRLSKVLKDELLKDKTTILYEATNKTGATVVDDFMLAASNYTGNKVAAGANVLLAQQQRAQDAADMVYLNATDNGVQRVNSAVKNWQSAQTVMRQAQYNREVSVMSMCAKGIQDSQKRMDHLIEQLGEIEDANSGQDLSDTDYEANISAMTSLQTRIQVEQYKMESYRTIMMQQQFNQMTLSEARTLINEGLLPVPNFRR